MKKVCHFTSVHPADDTRIFFKECSSLAKAGWETHLVAVNASEGKLNGVHIHSVHASKGSRLKRILLTAWNVYSQAAKLDCDCYHFHDPELIPYGLFLRWSGKKVIYDVHEDVSNDILLKEWIPRYIRNTVSYLFEKFEKFAASQFSAVVTATPHIAKQFQECNLLTVNVNNYPLLAEVNELVDYSIVTKQAVCYVGGISNIRGILEMVAALEHTQVKLMLAGLFSSDKQYEMAKRLRGWCKVEELGYLDRESVIKVMSESIAGLVLLHPTSTYRDSQPIKMFEYMSVGIPVIASNFPLWKNMMEENSCGICVDPLNPVEIASAINWVVEHPNEARKMGENGRKAILEKYNWEVEGKRLVNLYQGLL